jgi:two-component system, OmpR family, sensor kinase
MSVKKRLTGQFVWQLILAGMLMIVLIVGTFYFIVNKISELEMNRNFALAGLPKLVESISIHDGQIVFDEQLLEEAKEQGGWLQALNEQGEVISSYYKPDDVPISYSAGELASYIEGHKDFPYYLYIWMQYKNDTMYTLLYGVPKTNIELLQKIKQTGVLKNDTIELPTEILKQLQAAKGYVQVLDTNGSEIASILKKEGSIDQYSVQEITLRAMYSERYNSKLYFEYDDVTKQTWLLHMPIQSYGSEPGSIVTPELAYILIGFIFIIIVIIVIFLFLSLWYGNRFGTPILHMMNWLRSLAQGKYEEPRDLIGNPRSQTRSGKIKRKYRMYTDIIESLHHLTYSLKRNDEIRSQLEKTREEWITGVTHDMKTPLSSIMGYTHMIKADQYEWTNEEIREFAVIMNDKADYMDQLITDLSMTYRLKNESHLLKFESVEMNQFVQQCMVQFMNDPKYETANITLEQASEPIFFPIDANGFKRIIMNLLANALIHNPIGTMVQVSINFEPKGSFGICFQDDGEGMDEETTNQLFERYYRGTNTEGKGNGTGLGMAITKELVHKHGGIIEVVSAKGEGTQINLKF